MWIEAQVVVGSSLFRCVVCTPKMIAPRVSPNNCNKTNNMKFSNVFKLWQNSIMQKLELFTSLPTCLSCCILRDWLNLKSVIVLNSAFCCKSHREGFLDLLRSDEYVIHETVTFKSKRRIFNALQMFGKKLRSTKLTEELDVSQAKSVGTNCTNVTHMNLQSRACCTPELSGILNSRLYLESLVVQLGFSRIPLSIVLFKDVVLPKLNALAIYDYLEENLDLVSLMKNGRILRLCLCRNQISESILLQIPQLCPNLTALGLQVSHILTDDLLNHITKFCPHIVHLDISHNRLLTDEGILAAVQNLKGLQSLSIGGQHSVLTDASLVHIYTHCASTLHTLEVDCLEGMPSFSSDTINDLLVRCKQLRTFYCNDAYEDEMIIGDPLPPTIEFSPVALSRLTTLTLAGIVVNEQNMTTIGKYGNNLEVLSLQQNHMYSYQSLKVLFNGCPQLKRLYLSIEDNLGVEKHFDVVNIYELSLLAVDLWMQLRPGLVVDPNSSSRCYNLMEML